MYFGPHILRAWLDNCKISFNMSVCDICSIHESLLTMALCRVVIGVKYVASLLSIYGSVSTTVAFLLAVEKRSLTTVPVMPEYVDLVCFQNRFISKLSSQWLVV